MFFISISTISILNAKAGVNIRKQTQYRTLGYSVVEFRVVVVVVVIVEAC